MGGIPKETLIDMYRKMLTCRIFDNKVEELVAQGFPVMHHSGAGQEATPVGTCANLRKDDYLLPYHRGYNHYIAKGMDIKRILAELIGKRTGYCKGKAGPHLADPELHVMGRSGIQGAHIQIAAGIGLSIKLRKTDQVCVCLFGEGASNIGFFHEGVNLASVWKVPVIFVVENNMYSITTHYRTVTPIKDIADRATAYGVPGVVVDGNDVIAVYNAVHEAVKRARDGKGPTLIECKTYRWRGHQAGDVFHEVYRPKEEIEEWKKKDPIQRFEKKLIEMKVLTYEEIEIIKQDIQTTVNEAERFAKESPYPGREVVFEDLYA